MLSYKLTLRVILVISIAVEIFTNYLLASPFLTNTGLNDGNYISGCIVLIGKATEYLTVATVIKALESLLCNFIKFTAEPVLQESHVFLRVCHPQQAVASLYI